jgi:hypothetical protein
LAMSHINSTWARIMQFNLQVFIVCRARHCANWALVRDPFLGPAAVFSNWCWGGKWPGPCGQSTRGSSACILNWCTSEGCAFLSLAVFYGDCPLRTGCWVAS